MIHDTLPDMIEALPIKARLLGLDIGSKTIGLSISDSSRLVATSIDTIRRTKFFEDILILHQAVTERCRWPYSGSAGKYGWYGRPRLPVRPAIRGQC